MIISIPGLIAPEEASRIVERLETMNVEGAHGPVAADGGLSSTVQRALANNPLFEEVATPRRMGETQVLRLAAGESHDYPPGAPVLRPGTGEPMRADLVATVFLTDPAHYGGGELVVSPDSGQQTLKLGAGHAALFPAAARRRVAEVSDGVRWVAELPVQSMVRDDARRAILTELWSVSDWLDRLPLEARPRTERAAHALKRARTDLLRMWADV